MKKTGTLTPLVITSFMIMNACTLPARAEMFPEKSSPEAFSLVGGNTSEQPSVKPQRLNTPAAVGIILGCAALLSVVVFARKKALDTKGLHRPPSLQPTEKTTALAVEIKADAHSRQEANDKSKAGENQTSAEEVMKPCQDLQSPTKQDQQKEPTTSAPIAPPDHITSPITGISGNIPSVKKELVAAISPRQTNNTLPFKKYEKPQATWFQRTKENKKTVEKYRNTVVAQRFINLIAHYKQNPSTVGLANEQDAWHKSRLWTSSAYLFTPERGSRKNNSNVFLLLINGLIALKDDIAVKTTLTNNDITALQDKINNDSALKERFKKAFTHEKAT